MYCSPWQCRLLPAEVCRHLQALERVGFGDSTVKGAALGQVRNGLWDICHTAVVLITPWPLHCDPIAANLVT